MGSIVKFDKNRLGQNVRFLALQHGMKVGELETEAGVSSGYISRLLKSEETGSSSLLSLAVCASEKFGISLNTLLTANLSELLPNERYLAEFMAKLEMQTDQGILFWNYETAKMYLDENSGTRPLAIFRSTPDEAWKEFSSSFDPEHRLGKAVVNATFGPQNQDIYVFQVLKDGTSENFGYEVYFVEDICEAVPVFCAFPEDKLFRTIEALFKNACESSHQIRINKTARGWIDSYMSQFEEDDELPF